MLPSAAAASATVAMPLCEPSDSFAMISFATATVRHSNLRPEENRKRACVGLVVAGTGAGIQVGFYYIEVEGFWSALMTHAALRVLSSPEDNFYVALRDNNLHSSYPVPSVLRLHCVCV